MTKDSNSNPLGISNPVFIDPPEYTAPMKEWRAFLARWEKVAQTNPDPTVLLSVKHAKDVIARRTKKEKEPAPEPFADLDPEGPTRRWLRAHEKKYGKRPPRPPGQDLED